MIENKESKQWGIKSVINVFGDNLSQKAKNILYELSNQEKGNNYKILSFKWDKSLLFEFIDYRSIKELFRDIYYKKIYNRRRRKSATWIWYCTYCIKKKKNNARNPEYIKEKVNFLDSAKKFCDGRDMIINAFQDKIYKIYHEENMFEVEDNIRNENWL